MAEHPLPDDELDIIPEQTCPASDQSCFMAGAAVVGNPPGMLPRGRSRTFERVSARRRQTAHEP